VFYQNMISNFQCNGGQYVRTKIGNECRKRSMMWEEFSVVLFM